MLDAGWMDLVREDEDVVERISMETYDYCSLTLARSLQELGFEF